MQQAMSAADKSTSATSKRRSSGFDKRPEVVQRKISLELKAFLAVMGALLAALLFFELVSRT